MRGTDKLTGLLKTIGPGIMFAGAAIGASHLVQSTRAGASYGLELIWVVMLVNLLKYPFFEFGHRYVAATGENLLMGYKKLGTQVVWLFFIFNIALGIINTAGVTLVTSALTAFFFEVFFGWIVDIKTMAGIILSICLLLMVLGKYGLIDKIVKLLIVVLSISTLIAFISAVSYGQHIAHDFVRPEIFNAVGIGFLISLMGWMPTPIEASVWSSIWIKEREKQTGYKPKFKEVLIDFHLGYISTAILAVFFVGLGAYVMYGTGQEFSDNGVDFSKQLIRLYQVTLGDWTLPLISIIAMITMFSTSITVVDAYPRTLDESLKLIRGKSSQSEVTLIIWAIFNAAAGFMVIVFFVSGLKTLIDLATMISFLAAPVFALINFILVISKNTPKEYHPKLWLKALSWIGLIYFFGFAGIYIYTRF